MTFKRGDDVSVAFSGRRHRGEVLSHHNGWVMCHIRIDDPLWDYGSISARLDPTSTVCVRDQFVTDWCPDTPKRQ